MPSFIGQFPAVLSADVSRLSTVVLESCQLLLSSLVMGKIVPSIVPHSVCWPKMSQARENWQNGHRVSSDNRRRRYGVRRYLGAVTKQPSSWHYHLRSWLVSETLHQEGHAVPGAMLIV